MFLFRYINEITLPIIMGLISVYVVFVFRRNKMNLNGLIRSFLAGGIFYGGVSSIYLGSTGNTF